jgi:hypothetical protein
VHNVACGELNVKHFLEKVNIISEWSSYLGLSYSYGYLIFDVVGIFKAVFAATVQRTAAV